MISGVEGEILSERLPAPRRNARLRTPTRWSNSESCLLRAHESAYGIPEAIAGLAGRSHVAFGTRAHIIIERDRDLQPRLVGDCKFSMHATLQVHLLYRQAAMRLH
jgi:hypothetical protein